MKTLFTVLVMSTLAVSASALTLKEKKTYQEWMDILKTGNYDSAKTTKEKCGYEIPVTLEEKFVTPFMEANANAAAYCDDVRNKISNMCEDATSKAAIAAKIKKIHCTLAAKPDDAKFAIKGGTLTFTFGVKTSNIADKTKDYLENNL